MRKVFPSPKFAEVTAPSPVQPLRKVYLGRNYSLSEDTIYNAEKKNFLANTECDNNMQLPLFLRLARHVPGALWDTLKQAFFEFRSAGKWGKLITVLCLSGVIGLGIVIPPRRAPPPRVVIPWQQMTTDAQYVEAGLVCLFLFLVGGMLYYLKRSQRFVYGVVEVTVAMIACWKWYLPQGRTIPVMINEGTLSDVVAASTIVYIVVRGMDNCYEYSKARKQALEVRKPA